MPAVFRFQPSFRIGRQKRLKENERPRFPSTRLPTNNLNWSARLPLIPLWRISSSSVSPNNSSTETPNAQPFGGASPRRNVARLAFIERERALWNAERRTQLRLRQSCLSPQRRDTRAH